MKLCIQQPIYQFLVANPRSTSFAVTQALNKGVANPHDACTVRGALRDLEDKGLVKVERVIEAAPNSENGKRCGMLRYSVTTKPAEFGPSGRVLKRSIAPRKTSSPTAVKPTPAIDLTAPVRHTFGHPAKLVASGASSMKLAEPVKSAVTEITPTQEPSLTLFAGGRPWTFAITTAHELKTQLNKALP